ncbi:MAG: hypothetical protein AAF298_10910 [Cyanobacteria bacterium P01_A01_bin.40]
MTTRQFPARLHILVAKNQDVGIVIRRGPSKQVCILGWERKTNTFTVGQWLKGRIYERRSDISHSGKYWIYFAMNGKWNSEAKGAWTAIARVPWLKAIALLPKGDCWNGGGLFLDDKHYWLNGCHDLLFTSKEIVQHKSYQPKNHYGGECLNVYYNRLQRDGWNLICQKGQKWHSRTIFGKKLLHGWEIIKICHEQLNSPLGKGCYWDEHELRNQNGEILTQPGWEWADWVDNAIVFAESGCLYSIDIETDKHLSNPLLIHDFNGYEFENRQAPY